MLSLPLRLRRRLGALARLAAGGCVVAVLLAGHMLAAPAAAADGARPTNQESVIDSIEPAVDGVQVQVVGSDSFLQVRAEPGVEVAIPGYDGEPYLRIDGDGTVHRNDRSPATYLNMARDGSGALPEHTDSSADPQWVRIGDGGVVAWHDHRIHWMLDEAPGHDADGVVQEWMVPLVVDGTEVIVSGRLLHADDALAWTVALVVLAVLVGVGAFAIGARSLRARGALLAGASAIALVVAWAAHGVNPPDAGASLIPVLLPALALVLSIGSLIPIAGPGPKGKGRARDAASTVQLAVPLAAVALLVGWAVTRIGVLWMPFVPTALPMWVDRIGTAVALGVAVGVAAAILRSPSPQSVSPATPRVV